MKFSETRARVSRRRSKHYLPSPLSTSTLTPLQRARGRKRKPFMNAEYIRHTKGSVRVNDDDSTTVIKNCQPTSPHWDWMMVSLTDWLTHTHPLAVGSLVGALVSLLLHDPNWAWCDTELRKNNPKNLLKTWYIIHSMITPPPARGKEHRKYNETTRVAVLEHWHNTV